MSLDRLTHYVSLDGAGGVEQQFVEFVRAARVQRRTDHTVVACGRQVHPLIRERLTEARAPVTFEKYAGAFKLPKWPATLRRHHQQRLLARQRPDAVVVWNRLRDSLDTIAAAGVERTVYWERGASWFAGDSPAKRRFLDEVQAVICNSHAARRMLELRWNYRGQTRVVLNALRPSLLPHAPVPVRQLPDDRPVTLGMVARLLPIKGVAIAIQALARLRRDGVETCLRIAGDGPEMDRLQRLAHGLGVAEYVIFEGLVADMPGFYAGIDLLVHPALREPFGQIAIEAGAYGVPSVVAAVDGLVEVIDDGVTGACIAPTVPLEDYLELGGSTTDLPPFVYDPERDVIDTPRLVDPARLARVVCAIIEAPGRYAAMSAAGIAAVQQRFVFDAHVRDALASIEAFVNTGRLNGEPAA